MEPAIVKYYIDLRTSCILMKIYQDAQIESTKHSLQIDISHQLGMKA